MRKPRLPNTIPLQNKIGVLLMILISVFLSACGNKTIFDSTYVPDPAEVDLVDWEETFPFIYADWADSIHGEAYLSGDTNAPTCNDCHESPKEGVTINTAAYRLETPARCARCHDDSDLMAEYEIAEDVVETYLADFHGTTINYYASTDLTAMRSEAVCSDCHESHAIYPADDSCSSVNEANLQATCAKCHVDATQNFTSAYGHYRPVRSPASAKSDSVIVFVVKLLYQALIPILLGGMLAYIALDIFFRIKRKRKVKAIRETVEDQAKATPTPDESES
jgi:hypothetical protein